MRGLFRWAKGAELIKVDPTAGVSNPVRKGGDGFKVWSEQDMAAYEARWPLGTRQRVWLHVLAYTGLRRGDAVRLGRQHVRNGVATLKTEKSGYTVEVALPILPVLQATLDTGPCGDLTFVAGANARPLTKESFGNEFKAACKLAGVPGSAHGVRKIAATRAADNGATEAQLMAIFGWTDPKMAAHYTKTANRKRLAAEAMAKLNACGTSIPSPLHPVRAKGRKTK
jgi:integrase